MSAHTRQLQVSRVVINSSNFVIIKIYCAETDPSKYTSAVWCVTPREAFNNFILPRYALNFRLSTEQNKN